MAYIPDYQTNATRELAHDASALLRSALAALTQPKTHPADVALAKSRITDALEIVESMTKED